MSKHTPGPWTTPQPKAKRGTVDPYAIAGEGWSIFAANDGLVAKVYVRDYREEPGLSNAHLISAAPDMEAALRRMLKVDMQDCGPRVLCGKCDGCAARAALTKARGKS